MQTLDYLLTGKCTNFVIFSSNLLQANASSQGVFQLKLKSFMNKLGKDSNNRCCSGFRTSSGKCSETCSTKFRVCLKHYQATIDPNHECTFGEEITPVLGSNSIYSTSSPIEFALDFKWPGTFSLIIEAWHQNNRTTGKTSYYILLISTKNYKYYQGPGNSKQISNLNNLNCP